MASLKRKTPTEAVSGSIAWEKIVRRKVPTEMLVGICDPEEEIVGYEASTEDIARSEALTKEPDDNIVSAQELAWLEGKGLTFCKNITRQALYNTLEITLGKPRLIEKLKQINQN